MLLDLATKTYSETALAFFGISKSFLPKIRPSLFENFGLIANGIPFASMSVNVLIGDQQASLLGHWGREFQNRAKCTFGIGAFLLRATCSDPLPETPNLWTVLNTGAETFYLEEYPIVCAGSIINWLQQNLGIINSIDELNSSEISTLSAEESVYFVPNLSGCLFPLWDSESSGSFHNLSLKTSKSDICQSVLESIAFCVRLALDGKNISVLSIDGGMSSNRMFCQLLADVCQIQISNKFQLKVPV